MATNRILIIILICLTPVLIGNCLGCGTGSDLPHATAKDYWLVSGSLVMPSSISATATASLRPAVSYANMTAQLLDSIGQSLSEPVNIDAENGKFVFTRVLAGSNYRLNIVSASGKVLASHAIDSLAADTAGLVVNSRTTVVASLVKAGNHSVAATTFNRADADGHINLTPMVNLVENCWSGSFVAQHTHIDNIIIAYFGNAYLQNLVQQAESAD